MCAKAPLICLWFTNSSNWMSLTQTTWSEPWVPWVVVWIVLWGVVVVLVPKGSERLLKRHLVLPESNKQINGWPHNCPLNYFAFNKTIEARSVWQVLFGVGITNIQLMSSWDSYFGSIQIWSEQINYFVHTFHIIHFNVFHWH